VRVAVGDEILCCHLQELLCAKEVPELTRDERFEPQPAVGRQEIGVAIVEVANL
jgi:hypothetical protein